MPVLDCVVVGFNEREFDIEVAEARASGEASVAFSDMRLAYLEHDNRSLRALDVINMLRTEPVAGASGPLSNADFMWPVVLILRTALHRGGLSSDHVNLIAREKRKLARLLTTQSPRAVAITTTLYVSHEAIVEVTRFVRRYNRKTRIILGGPYIANNFRRLEPSRRVELYEYLRADYYVTCAEGEATLVSLVGELASGDPHMSTIPNLALRDGDGFVETAARVEDNVVSTPVDYDLFPPEAFNAFLSVRTAKSCPFSCSFCAFPQQSGAYTYLDVADVERELDKTAGLGVKTLSFIDDTFNVPKNRFRDLLRMMIADDYGFRWNSFYRSDHGDRETIELMARSGCEGVFLGVESGSDTILAMMNKRSRQRHYREAIRALRDFDILSHASLIIGFPGETAATVAETETFLVEARPDTFRSQVWYADPGTPIWDRRDEVGLVGIGFEWSHWTMSSTEAADVVDDIMATTLGSAWLPQAGFEQWSLFYLLRLGMPRPQLMSFLHEFRACLTAQMTSGSRSIEPFRLERLRELSQFGCASSEDATMSAKEVNHA